MLFEEIEPQHTQHCFVLVSEREMEECHGRKKSQMGTVTSCHHQAEQGLKPLLQRAPFVIRSLRSLHFGYYIIVGSMALEGERYGEEITGYRAVDFIALSRILAVVTAITVESREASKFLG